MLHVGKKNRTVGATLMNQDSSRSHSIFTITIETSEDTILRFGFSESVTRPTLTSLGVNNVFGGRSNAPTSGGGNPFLEAFESTNWDASFEWYFDDVSYFSVAAFYKDFDNFLESQTLPV